VFVLVLARPELGQARRGFGTGRNRSTLTLDPLDPVSMDALVDALEPGPRRLVADAAVLGTSFSVEALAAMSARNQPAVRAALDELVRREVFTVSADRLSPEKGSYGFAQTMLRQVAYDTLSRRDRKSGHLKAAAHLRAAFPGDGEEVADLIARHYLDALAAVPDDGDAGEIRGRAIAALLRAGERAERTGAPAMAVTAYATAADLTRAQPGPAGQAGSSQPEAGALLERAAKAAILDGRWAAAIEHAGGAREYHLRRGDARAAARAQTIAGQALRLWGRHSAAREQLEPAVEVLRADPGPDAVHALDQLATLEALNGSPDADRLTRELLALGQVSIVPPPSPPRERRCPASGPKSADCPAAAVGPATAAPNGNRPASQFRTSQAPCQLAAPTRMRRRPRFRKPRITRSMADGQSIVGQPADTAGVSQATQRGGPVPAGGRRGG